MTAHKGATIEYDYTYQHRVVVQTNREHPEGYSLEKMNGAHARDRLVNQELSEYWYSIEDFLEHGVGYVIKQDNHVLCACYSSSVNGAEHEIYIATFSEEIRGQGLATIAAAAYLEDGPVAPVTPVKPVKPVKPVAPVGP